MGADATPSPVNSKLKPAPKRHLKRKTLPSVNSKYSRPTAIFHYWEAQRRTLVEVQLDSEQWFSWLTTEQSFRFIYWKEAGNFVNFTVRPEKRGQRTYWQGWKTIRGQTTKKYIAPSPKMTKAKLDQVGEWFYEQVKNRTEADPEMLSYIMIDDLTALVEKLIYHCQNPTLADQARRELERINCQFSN
jgi:hypothetical protein